MEVDAVLQEKVRKKATLNWGYELWALPNVAC